MSAQPPQMQLTDILQYLPHRYPFLLVDRVTSINGNSILAHKCVTFNEQFFQGHFPGAPIMPGMLILEALAQVMPDAQTVLLPHIGHWPQLEDPEGFDAALLDFLAQRRVLH